MSRTSFNTARLVRLLAAPAGGEEGPESSLAERLGHWLGLNDAIALSGALAAGAPPAASVSVSGIPDGAPPREDFARVRASLMASIRGEPQPGSAPTRSFGLAATDGSIDFAACRRHYAARQREMELAVGTLRARVRKALAAASPALAALAELDAVLEKALGERERALLAGIPVLLERRFARLRATGAGGQDDAPAAFGRELQTVLLAELEVRLLPVAGLVEALAEAFSAPATAPRPPGRESAPAPVLS